MEKIPLKQLLMSVASLHAANGDLLKENAYFARIAYNLTSTLDSLNLTLENHENYSLHHLKNKNGDERNVVEIEETTPTYNRTSTFYPDTHNDTSLSIMWYLASFGVLIMFFLIISFSEVCCKKSFSVPAENEEEVAPPSYDLFAPPSYDSLFDKKKEKTYKTKKKKKKCKVFVISVLTNKIIPRVPPVDPSQRNDTGSSQETTSPPFT